jgi:adenosine deaminase
MNESDRVKKTGLDAVPTPEWVRRVPKTDLHCHLGGSLRLETLIDEARRQGVSLPAEDAGSLAPYVVKADASSLEDYLKAFAITESVLKNARALERAAFELVEDAHRENIKILEVRYAPTNYRTKSLKLFQIVESVLAGLQRGSREYGVHAGLIICGMRNNMDATREAVRLAADYKLEGVVGFDLAGPEHGYPPKQFESVLSPVFSSFIPVTIHAGEAYGAKSIADAIIYLNARRIGHATNLFELRGLTDYIEITGLALETCVSSNLHTRVIPSVQTHPIRQMMRRGLRVSLNTDNRLVSRTDITNEMMLLVNELGFVKRDLLRLVKDGVKSSFFRKEIKRQALDKIDTEIAELTCA